VACVPTACIVPAALYAEMIWCQAVGALFVGMLSELVYTSVLGMLGGLAYGARCRMWCGEAGRGITDRCRCTLPAGRFLCC
jgi:hypothetical protein